MKSIIQEASSIAKAIETGWLKAGKPQDFSIKVFQEAEKNFFGMTTKPAKIAIIFNEHVEQQPRQPKQQRPIAEQVERIKQPAAARPTQEKRKREEKKEFKKPMELETQRPKVAPAKAISQRVLPEEGTARASAWTDELSIAAATWLRESLPLLGFSHVSFSTNVNRQLLKISFSEPLLADDTKQKHLFRSIAFLLMQTLRRQFKKSLRNARIVLVCEK